MPTPKYISAAVERFNSQLLSEDPMAKGFYHWKAIDRFGEPDIDLIKNFLTTELTNLRTQTIAEVEGLLVDEPQLDPLTANKVISLPHDVLLVDRGYLRNQLRQELRTKLESLQPTQETQ